MHLLNTDTVKLEEFGTFDSVKYAILSHRWESGEVSFRDLDMNLDIAHKEGYTKIQRACRVAAAQGYEFIWIDTCCINKDSSAELSEAINSMFRWYQAADICYAYLSDVQQYPMDVDEFKSSQWFTRGWTLQELLAPKWVAFLNREWKFLGWKHHLVQTIAEITGINNDALTSVEGVFESAISERMTWASKRKTTRVEDSAYSLMGLFNVNMPMLYGEGPKAFIRLQEEIIKHSTDQTIFAWSGSATHQGGLLAPSVQCFANIPLFEPVPLSVGEDIVDPIETQRYSLTNAGLSISLSLRPWDSYIYLAELRCRVVRSYLSTVGIFLYRLEERGRYRRVFSKHFQSDLYISNLEPFPKDFFQVVKVHVPQPDLAITSVWKPETQFRPSLRFLIQDYISQNSQKRLHGDVSGVLDAENAVADYRPNMPCRFDSRYHIAMSGSGRVFCSDLKWLDPDLGVMLLGFDFEFMPVCVIAHREAPRSFDDATLDGLKKQSVRKKSIVDVTCLESLGWSMPFPLSFGKWANSCMNENGLWALKCDRDINRWRCTMKKTQDNGNTDEQKMCYVTIKKVSGFSGWVVKISTDPIFEHSPLWILRSLSQNAEHAEQLIPLSAG